MSLGRRAGIGIAWAYGAFLGQKLLNLLTTAVLARLLFPADFGVIAFALVVVGLIDAVRDLGVKDALIYDADEGGEAADTAFAINVAMGVLQGLALLLLAPAAAALIDDPRTTGVLRAMAIVPVINALAVTHDGLLQRALSFRRCYAADFLAALGRTAVTLGLAFAGCGLWSIVAGLIAGAAGRTWGRWLLLPWRPRRRFVAARARALLGYGVHVLTVRLLDVLLERADQLLIAILLGPVQLAFYYMAARIPEIAIANFNQVLTQVLFPAYARIADDRARLTAAYRQATRYTALAIVPAGVGLALVAPELVPVVFGARWAPAVPLVQVLALVGVAASLPWSAGDVLKAIGRPDIPTRLVLLEALYSFPLVVLLGVVSRQALWIALAYLIALSLTAIIRLWVVRRFLALPRGFYAGLFAAPFAASGLMAAGVAALRHALAGWPPMAILSVSILGGALIYGAAALLLAGPDLRRAAAELRLLLPQLLRRSA
ncbi:MAG: lipopolysaccharide biosynthesis protein [Dongiaceae bacterium]